MSNPDDTPIAPLPAGNDATTATMAIVLEMQKHKMAMQEQWTQFMSQIYNFEQSPNFDQR